MGSRAKTEDGHDVPLAMFGLVMYFVTYIGSVLLWVIFCLVEFAIPKGIITGGVMYWDSYNLAAQSWPWLSLILSTWAAVLPAFVYKCYCDCYEPDVNEKWKQAGALEAEQEAEALQQQRENRAKATPEEVERMNKIAKGKTDVGDAGVNTAHAAQGRVHVRHPEASKGLRTALAVNKFKGMSNTFKNRTKAS